VIVLHVNVAGILKKSDATLEFEGEQLLTDIEYQGERIGFVYPLRLKGVISNTGQMLLAKLSLEGFIELQCGACTKVYNDSIVLSFEAVYKRFKDTEDPDVFTYQNDRVDFHDAVLEYVLLNLPTRRRCREDCLGLCPRCGIDLNVDMCRCDNP